MADNTIDILLNARMNVSDAVGGVSEIQRAMRGLTLPKGISADLEKSFSKLTPLLKDYQKQLNKGFSSQKDIKNFNLLKEKIDSVFGDIKSQIKEVNGQEIRLKVNTQEIDAVKNKIVKAQADLNNALQNVFKKNQSAASIETAFGKLENAIPKNWTKVTGMMSKASGSFKAGNYAEFNRQLQNTLNYIQKLSNVSQVDLAHRLGMDKAKTDITEAQKYFNNFFNSLKTNIKEANNIESLRTKLSELGVELEGLNTKSLEDGPKAFEEWVQSIMNVDGALDQLHGSTQNTANSMVRMVDEVNELKSSTQYFFSLRNMINLLKRGIDDAVQSVKELDKAMTETAVVTDFSVADMWKDLPKYTKIANDLGATTQGAYETMTLYYQQGLNQQQAFELGAETMKMARIAGLEYAEATDMMTAALRGFNMELNETSAKRVNDVYSELAAITASDTEELGTAMQRTASIAHSAGASFEGATAFLAQAIETTREPAENIGTAMKTIIARFQEMKKNPLEISEVDGEEVDYNKIDAALKTIGVDLKDTNGQFREWDKVMLDISAKWDTLSQSQQRYIATTAAGSRQQSRFIAMVSNYDRTMQLMEAANNSTGASEEQFGKTMDSLEAKLNKLHNAWQQFTMGIANNGMIKGAVDGITGLLTVTNKLIDTFSLGIGPVKSLLSLLMAFTGLKMTGRFANSLIGGLGGILDPSVGFGKGFLGGAIGARQQASAAQAQMIYQPIVNELRALPARMKEQNVPTEGTAQDTVPFNQQAFKQAKNNIAELTKYGQKYSADAIVKQFKGLNIEQQKVLRNTMIGTSSKVDTALLGRYGAQDKAQSKAIQMAASNYRNQAKIGTIAWGEYYDKVSDPMAMKKALDGNPKVSQATMEWVSGMADKTTDQAKANIAKAMEDKLYNSGAFDAVTNEQEYQKILNDAAETKWKEMSEAQQAAARRKAWRDINPEELLQNNTGTELLNGLGQIGIGISSAGMSLQSFGALLTSSANPALQAFGGALTAVGGVLSSVGMGLSGLVSGFNALTNSGAMKGLANGLSSALGTTISAGATTGILAGVAALTAIAVSAYKKHIQKLKDAGENVVKEYKEANEKYTSSISDLTAWQQELPRLQEGVDAYGNNVSLDTTDYERYKEIINGIAELNPDIVEGYNAQGDAIIRNNGALDQTLAKQRELQKLATEEYLSQQSLATLIRARDTTDAFKKDKAAGGTESVVEAHNLISAMRQAGLGDSFFEALGFDYSKLQASHNNPEIQRFIMENEQIAREISEFYDQAGVDIDSHISEGLDNLTVAVDAEKEAIQDVYDNLMTYTSVNHLAPTNLPANLQGSFNKGIELIAKSRLGAVGMQKAVENLSKRYSVLTNENSQYNKIMEEVRSGQEEYSRTLDASGYKGEEYRNKLLTLAEGEQELADKTDVLQDKIAHTNLAEFYTNEAEKAFNFTNKQITDLTDAFAQFTDEINIAKNAYTDWQKQLENLNSPEQGVNSYKQILDDVFKETEDSSGTKHQYNTEAKGRPELWTGAAQILSEDWMRGKDTDAVANKLKSLQPLFKEGQEGAIALGNKIRDALQAGEEFDGHKFSEFFEITDKGVSVKDGVNISDELTESLAHYWDMQTPALVAALQNASQYGISLMKSTADQRAAISNDVRASAGVKSHATDELGRDITDLIVPRDVLVEGFHAAGEYNEAVIREGIVALRKQQGVFTAERVLATKNAEKLQKEYGITQDNFLKVLGQHLGEDEVKETYEGYYGKGSWTDEQQTQYDEIQSGIQSALEETTSEVPDIASSVANIESMLAAKLYESGDATNFEKLDEFHKAIKGDEQLIDTATDKLVAAGADKEHQYTKKDFDQYYKDNEAALKASEALIKQLEAGRDKWKGQEDSEQYKSYSEQLAQAKKDYQYALAAKENADNYAKEQGWDGSSQPPSFNEAQIQSKINEVVSAGWGQLLEGIPSTVLATPKAQNAMSVLARNAFNPDMLSGPIAPEIQRALSDLGISIDDALQSGMNAWPDASETEAKAEQKGEEIEQAGKEAGSSMLKMIDTSWIGDLATGIINKYEESVNNNPITIPEITPNVEQGANEVSKIAQGAVTAATLTVDTSDSDAKLDATQQKTNEVANTINQGATFTISVPGIANLNKAAQAAQSIGKNAGKQTVGVKTSFDNKAVQTGVKAITAMTPKMQVGADTKQATTAAEKARGIIDNKKATIDVSINQTGNRTVSIIVKKNGSTVGTTSEGLYTGANNKIFYTHVPEAGSLAGGTKKGRVGPRNQGGMTLTGELGYEIAWLPSQNKSVVLGAKGPQMVNLPKDAVVYNHEQSKDIMKKRSNIQGGSLWDGYIPTSTSNSNNSGGNPGGDSQTTATQRKVQQAADTVAQTATQTATKLVRVSVWWENIARKTEATQRAMDKALKAFETFTQKMDSTLANTAKSVAEGGGGGNDYIKAIGEYKGYNQAQVEQADKELKVLTTNPKSLKTKAQKKADKAVKKAKKTKDKKDDKEAKKKQKEANYNAGAAVQVSYEKTVTNKKTGKKEKKSVTSIVNTAPYIKSDGTIDESKLKTIKNKNKRKAVADALNQEINDKLKKKYSAEDAIEKANEALEKMGEELYETFFAWEVELTKIWNITQKIADHQSKQARAEGYTGLLEAQVDSGQISVIDKEGNINTDFIKSVNEAYGKGIQERINVIGLMQEGIGDHIKDLQLLMSSADEQTTLANVKALVANTEAYNTAQESLEVAAEAADEATETIADANSRIKKDKKIINKSKDKTKVKKAKADKKDAQADRKEAEQDLALHQNEMNAAQAIIDQLENSGVARLEDETQLLAYKQEAKELEDSIKIIDMANSYINKGEGVKVNDDGTLIIDFDTDALEADKQAGKITADTAQKIQDHIQKLVDGSQNLQEAYNNLTSELTELHTTLAGLKEAWAGYSEDLMSYLEDKQQKEIDKLKQLSSAIADQMKNLLDQVKRSLDQRRRQEDNQKTEQDISKKQQRLAALQADTSGGHQVEIAQLQQEITDAQTNYQRTLEDQLLDNLQQNTDIANEQRERQISLQEAILNAVDKASIVNDWMDDPDTYRKNIAAAFYEATNYDNLPLAKQQALDDQFDKLFLGLKTNQEKQESVVDAINATAGAAKLIEQSMGSVGQEVTQTEVKTDVKAIAEELKKDIADARTAAEDAQTKAIAAGNQATYSSNLAGIHTRQTVNASEFKNMVNYGAASGVDKSIYQVAHDLVGGDGSGGVTWKEVIQAAKDAGYKPAEIKNWTSDPSSTFIKAFNSVFKAKKGKKTAWESYATGGLADYTGPAWLDGTPSKPELILNAKDTANFIALKDVLAKVMNGIGDTSNTYGDISYEININVDKIEKDYDVDRVVEKVKKEIVKGAGYRNVTQVRSFR